MEKLSRIIGSGPTIGADPEVFLVRRTKAGARIVTGSEKVVPPEGLTTDHFDYNHNPVRKIKKAIVVRDGVQAELHPHHGTCRAGFAGQLGLCIRALIEASEKAGLEVDFSQVVKITSRELSKLSPEAQILGCQPSFNVYGTEQIAIADGRKVLTRSGSGHIHLGTSIIGSGAMQVSPENLVRVLDRVLGIPSVLLDTDPAAAVRRRLYGRAGEYRLPKYGLEYRTLSNFWLRSYVLSSFVTGQARVALDICYTSTLKDGVYGYRDVDREMMGRLLNIPDDEVRIAIDKNDVKKAQALYEKYIRPEFARIVGSGTGIDSSNVKDFDFFVSKGLDFWFPKTNDAITKYWKDAARGLGAGFENFMTGKVRSTAGKEGINTAKQVLAQAA